MPYPTVPYPTIPYPTLPYPTLVYRKLPNPTLQPYPTLPYPPLPSPPLPSPSPCHSRGTRFLDAPSPIPTPYSQKYSLLQDQLCSFAHLLLQTVCASQHPAWPFCTHVCRPCHHTITKIIAPFTTHIRYVYDTEPLAYVRTYYIIPSYIRTEGPKLNATDKTNPARSRSRAPASIWLSPQKYYTSTTTKAQETKRASRFARTPNFLSPQRNKLGLEESSRKKMPRAYYDIPRP